METLRFLTITLLLMAMFMATVVLFLANRTKPIRLRLVDYQRNTGRRSDSR
jgi:hypothetical protein